LNSISTDFPSPSTSQHSSREFWAFFLKNEQSNIEEIRFRNGSSICRRRIQFHDIWRYYKPLSIVASSISSEKTVRAKHFERKTFIYLVNGRVHDFAINLKIFICTLQSIWHAKNGSFHSLDLLRLIINRTADQSIFARFTCQRLTLEYSGERKAQGAWDRTVVSCWCGALLIDLC
jgi:hypothetical protein